MNVGKKNVERKKLLQRQARFINLLSEARYTTEEIIAKVQVGRRTLTRWRSEPLFRREWNYAIRTLKMRRESDEATSGIRAANQEMGRMRETGEVEMAGAEGGEAEVETGEVETERRGAGGSAGVMSERERILRRNGKEAAEAYDRLMRLHEMHRQEQEAAEAKQSSEEEESASAGASPTEVKQVDEREEVGETSPVIAKSGENGEPPANIPPPGLANGNGAELKTMGEIRS